MKVTIVLLVVIGCISGSVGHSYYDHDDVYEEVIDDENVLVDKIPEEKPFVVDKVQEEKQFVVDKVQDDKDVMIERVIFHFTVPVFPRFYPGLFPRGMVRGSLFPPNHETYGTDHEYERPSGYKRKQKKRRQYVL